MNPLQIELTKLIGKKESCNCLNDSHKTTLTDFHRWMNENRRLWEHSFGKIKCFLTSEGIYRSIPYDSSLGLLEQNEDTLQHIIDLIKSNQ